MREVEASNVHSVAEHVTKNGHLQVDEELVMSVGSTWRHEERMEEASVALKVEDAI